MLHIVVAYDVVDDYKRTHLMKFLKRYLEHVQKSVFEGDVAQPQLETMRAGIRERIDANVDSVRIYSVCGKCEAATEVIGTGIYVEADEGDMLF